MKILVHSLWALVTATAMAGPTPTPPTLSIAGTIGQCSTGGPSGISLPNVTVELTGTINASTTTDASGNYFFSGLTYGGSYTVTPSKARLMPGSSGIDKDDVSEAIRLRGPIQRPVECLLVAADVNGIHGIDYVDIIAIQRFSLGLSTGIANVGSYQFTPVNRSYSPLLTNQTAQNYDTILFGDLAPPYAIP